MPPLAGETTWSFVGRIAGRYGLEPTALRFGWRWGNQQPRLESGGVRADAEMLLNEAGRQLLGQLCGVDMGVLARALPVFGRDDAKLTGQEDGEPRAVWRVGGAVGGPVAFHCRLCTARRCGMAVPVVRYVPRWERVCIRHARWQLDADADQELAHLDLCDLPEVVAAQRRWGGVVRRAVRRGVEPERVFALAYAVVARWWEQALSWERETVWPWRLRRVAGGDAGCDLEWWRVVGRDAVIFPEVVAVADALLDPAMAELAWEDSGGEQPRPLPVDGALSRELGERVGRSWLGPLAVTDYGGPLTSWMGAVIRIRRGVGGPSGYADDPWWVRREHQPASMAGQLRVLGKERRVPGSGTMWRAAVPAEQRALIGRLVEGAEEQLLQLHGAQTGPTADVARHLVRNLRHSAGLLQDAWRRTVVAAAGAGVPLEEVAQWSGLAVGAVEHVLAAEEEEGG